MPRASLPAKFALAGPEGFDPADDPLGALLLDRGYTVGSLTLNLTAARETVAAADPGGPALTISRRAHAAVAAGLPPHPRDGARARPRPCCSAARRWSSPASLPGGGLSQQLGLRDADAAGTTPISLARLGIGAGWAGLGAVWTDPAYRGRGLAAHLTAGLAVAAPRGRHHTAPPPGGARQPSRDRSVPTARLRRALLLRLPDLAGPSAAVGSSAFMSEIRFATHRAATRGDGKRLWPAYDEVFADQPNPATWLGETWDRHRQRDGFRVCSAFAGQTVVGFAWGYLGRSGQWWTDAVSAKLDPGIVRDWVGDHFELVSLGVVPAARRQHVGRDLLRRIGSSASSDRLLLQTTADPADPARRLYASEGWQVLGPGATDGTVVMGRRRSATTKQRPGSAGG